MGTKQLLLQALNKVGFKKGCRLISDAGVENMNKMVETITRQNIICHQVAQLDIEQSNSMIEAFFRSLKQYSIYKNELMDLDHAQAIIDGYVRKCNEEIPRHGLGGLTPKEKFYKLKVAIGRLSPIGVLQVERMHDNRQWCQSKFGQLRAIFFK